MAGTVTKLCVVEAFDGDVVIECGVAATTLTPEVARNAGERLIGEAKRAEADRKAKQR